MVVELPFVSGEEDVAEPLLLAGVVVVVVLPEEPAGFDCVGTRAEVMLLNDMSGSGRRISCHRIREPALQGGQSTWFPAPDTLQ